MIAEKRKLFFSFFEYSTQMQVGESELTNSCDVGRKTKQLVR